MKKLCVTLVVAAMSTALVVTARFEASPILDAVDGVDVPAGPIWNNDDAKIKCPAVCTAAGVHWNGQWRTVVPGRSSVCGCE